MQISMLKHTVMSKRLIALRMTMFAKLSWMHWGESTSLAAAFHETCIKIL